MSVVNSWNCSRMISWVLKRLGIVGKSLERVGECWKRLEIFGNVIKGLGRVRNCREEFGKVL